MNKNKNQIDKINAKSSVDCQVSAPPKLKQCAFLNEKGKRCRKKSALKLRVFLDPTHYKESPWVEVNFCIDHYLHCGGKFIKAH